MEIENASVVTDCPTCGRPMRIQMEYLGREVLCGHCGCGSTLQVKYPASNEPFEIVQSFSMANNDRIGHILRFQEARRTDHIG